MALRPHHQQRCRFQRVLRSPRSGTFSRSAVHELQHVSPDADGYSVLLDPSYCGASDHSYTCLARHLLNTVL